jgi:hypothetical protein
MPAFELAQPLARMATIAQARLALKAVFIRWSPLVIRKADTDHYRGRPALSDMAVFTIRNEMFRTALGSLANLRLISPELVRTACFP